MTPPNILKNICHYEDNNSVISLSRSLTSDRLHVYAPPNARLQSSRFVCRSPRQGDSLSSIENAVKYNPMYESDTTGYSHYYRRYPQLTSYSSTSADTSTDYSSEEIRHIYENSELTKEVSDMAFILAQTYNS